MQISKNDDSLANAFGLNQDQRKVIEARREQLQSFLAGGIHTFLRDEDAVEMVVRRDPVLAAADAEAAVAAAAAASGSKDAPATATGPAREPLSSAMVHLVQVMVDIIHLGHGFDTFEVEDTSVKKKRHDPPVMREMVRPCLYDITVEVGSAEHVREADVVLKTIALSPMEAAKQVCGLSVKRRSTI